MLNAMLLRTKLAGVAGLQIKPEVLAKLMVLEYTHPKLFRHLDNWQTTGKGHPEELRRLEEASSQNEKLDDFPDWSKPGVQNWLQMEPTNLRDEDLRDYFWVARDRTKSTLSAASMVSPVVNAIYLQLVEGNEGEQLMAANKVPEMDALQVDALLSLLDARIRRHPDEDAAPDALKLLVEKSIEGAGETLINALSHVSRDSLSPSVVQNVATLGRTQESLREPTVTLLRRLAEKPDTGAGAAAEIALQEFREGG